MFSEDDMASDGSDWTDPDFSSSEEDHTIKSEEYDMEIDGPGEESKFADAACYVRCILGYRVNCRESHDELDDRMLDLATLPTRDGSIFVRDIIAILRARTFNFGAQDVCFDILDHLVSNNCVDEEIIQDLVYLARESMQDLQERKADITQVLSVFANVFQSSTKTQGSIERRVGVAVKAGLLDVILGFLRFVAENPQLQDFESTEDALSVASRVLEKVACVANRKKARIAIIACQGGVLRELSSLRQHFQAIQTRECVGVLNKLQSVLDEGTGPVARRCSVCSRILCSGAIFRCERCCDVYCSPACQKKAWQAGHRSSCTKGRVKLCISNTSMLKRHTDYMLRMWIEHGESELVKAMEQALVFPRAGATVLSGCARILFVKLFDAGSIVWGQVGDMITTLYENKLVTKPDIDAGMVALAHTAIDLSDLSSLGGLFCVLASKNLYTVEQLCSTTSTFRVCTRILLIRVCLERMYASFGIELTKEHFCEPHKRTLLEEYLGAPAFSELLAEFNFDL